MPETLPVNILTARHEAAHLAVGHFVTSDAKVARRPAIGGTRLLAECTSCLTGARLSERRGDRLVHELLERGHR